MSDGNYLLRDDVVLVDHTVSASVANQAHGPRYGVDWVWHHDEIGVLYPQSKVDELERVVSSLRLELAAAEHNRLAGNRELLSQRDKLLSCLKDLHAMVWGECPSLLNEDSGGSAHLDLDIRSAIAEVEGWV